MSLATPLPATASPAAGPLAQVDAPPEQTVEVAGHEVVYRRRGTGEPVLFLHGSHFADRWLAFHEHLASTVDLVAPLHPGIAEADVPDWLGGFDDLVLHYRDLLDALGLPGAHLVGYGLGGWVAADLAVFFPERVKSLTLLAPLGLRVPGSPVADYLGTAPQQVAELLFNGDPGTFAGELPDPADRESFARAYGQSGVSARLMWGRRYDLKLERRLPRLPHAALVVAAEDDRIVSAAHAERWVELLPEARLVSLTGVGHAFPVQQPEATARLVADFVRSHPVPPIPSSRQGAAS